MKRLAAIALALIGLTTGALCADDYPTRPIRILVPYSPGGIADIAARIVGAKLTEAWGQQTVVDIPLFTGEPVDIVKHQTGPDLEVCLSLFRLLCPVEIIGPVRPFFPTHGMLDVPIAEYAGSIKVFFVTGGHIQRGQPHTPGGGIPGKGPVILWVVLPHSAEIGRFAAVEYL